MENSKEQLAKMMNYALELEHAARIQYLAHAELIKGLNAEAIIKRLEEIASDEEKHQVKFRNMIGNYLGGEPSMGIAPTHKAKEINDILGINLKDEKTAIDFYKTIYKKIVENKDGLPYAFETLEHEVRHIIMDEQEHAAELAVLLGFNVESGKATPKEEATSKKDAEAPASKYRCKVCGYIYDPEKGDPDHGIKPGTSFEELPDSWACPECNVNKAQFEKIS